MRHTNQAGLELIKSYEGFSATPYICPAGWLTVGFGHVVRQGEDFKDGISEAEAIELLAADLSIAERAVLRYISVPLTDNQFAALVSFTFNLGGGALQRSTLRRIINREEHDDVPAQLMRWVRAGGRVSRGLVRRRIAEGELYQA